MHQNSRTRVAIYATTPAGTTGDQLTTGFLIQRWLGLALAPPNEPLWDLGAAAGPDGGLRLRAAIDDGSTDETIDATAYFNDPGEGMLAFLLLDRESSCRSDPLPPLDRPDPTEEEVAASISAYVLGREVPAMRVAAPVPVAAPSTERAQAAEPAQAAGPEQYPDALLGPDWPRPYGPISNHRPATWPPGLPWPPSWEDNEILRQICHACPCFILCPPCHGAS